MRKYILAFAPVATLFGLAGCVAVDAKMESWTGRQVSDVIASWGQPDHVYDAGNGNQEFVWSVTRSSTSPGTAIQIPASPPDDERQTYGGSYNTSIDSTPQIISSTATRSFWVHSDGEIYRWAWHGL